MVGLGAVPAVTQTVMLLFMPETPRFLFAKKGEEEKARQILKKVYYHTTPDLHQTVETTLTAMKVEIMQEEEAATSIKSGHSVTSSRFMTTLSSLPHARALFIACLLQGFQQACGFNSLMYVNRSSFSTMY